MVFLLRSADFPILIPAFLSARRDLLWSDAAQLLLESVGMSPTSVVHRNLATSGSPLPSNVSLGGDLRGDEGVRRHVDAAVSLAHSSSGVKDDHARDLDTVDTTLRAIEAASTNPEAYRSELARVVALLSRGFVLHDSFEGVQRGVRNFITNQGSWDEVETHRAALEKYRCDVERTLLSIQEGGENDRIHQLLKQLGEELRQVRCLVAPESPQSGFRKTFGGFFRGDHRAEGRSGVENVNAKGTLAIREGWYNEFTSVLRSVMDRAHEGTSGQPLLTLKEALRWGPLCQRIGKSSMNTPAPGFDSSGWSSVWAQFSHACAPLFSILPPVLRPSCSVDRGTESSTAVAPLTARQVPVSPASIEATGSSSLVSRLEDILRMRLSSGAAGEVSYALQKSFLWGRTSPEEKVRLVEHVVSWHRRALDSYGGGEIDVTASQALRSLAERMLDEDVCSYASPREIGLIRGTLGAPSLTFQRRQNLIHTLTTVYARGLFRTTVSSLTERFLARGVEEPVFSDVVARNLAAINERLGVLAASYSKVYPGIALSARWGRRGCVAIVVSQGDEGLLFEAHSLRANPVFFAAEADSQEGVLNRAVKAVCEGSPESPSKEIPLSFSFEYRDGRAVDDTEMDSSSGELSSDESALIEGILTPRDDWDTARFSEVVEGEERYRSRVRRLISTPSVRADGITLSRREDGSLLVTFGKLRWAIEGEEPNNVSADSISPGALFVSKREWSTVELAVAQFYSRQEIRRQSSETRRGGIVALHLDGLIGSDELSQYRIERMARAAAHLHFATVVVALGSDSLVERFAREFERAERSDGAKPPLFRSLDNMTWAGGRDRVAHVLTRSELALNQAASISSRVVLEDPVIGEESGVALFSPWLFRAQEQTRM